MDICKQPKMTPAHIFIKSKNLAHAVDKFPKRLKTCAEA